MIKFQLYCAMCGKEKDYEPDCNQIGQGTSLAEVVQSAGWVVQQNGDNLDIYCSRRCAE